MSERKYDYLWVIQGNYGQGWEDVTAEEDQTEARARRREYNENEPQFAHRTIRRRVPREGN